MIDPLRRKLLNPSDSNGILTLYTTMLQQLNHDPHLLIPTSTAVTHSQASTVVSCGGTCQSERTKITWGTRWQTRYQVISISLSLKGIGSGASLGQIALACRGAGFGHRKSSIGGEGIGDIVGPVPSWNSTPKVLLALSDRRTNENPKLGGY